MTIIMNKRYVNAKVKFILLKDMKALRGSRG
jgi:hypothetical protein